jgi:hypothetical protein
VLGDLPHRPYLIATTDALRAFRTRYATAGCDRFTDGECVNFDPGLQTAAPAEMLVSVARSLNMPGRAMRRAPSIEIAPEGAAGRRDRDRVAAF